MIILVDTLVPEARMNNSYKYPPLGLAALAGVLKRMDQPCELVLFREDDDLEEWAENILSLDPDVVAFTVYIGYKLMMARKLGRILKKKRPGIRILWGGPLPSALPEKSLEDESVDWICVGPGETMLPDFVRFLSGEIDPSLVPGMGYMAEGSVVLNPLEPPGEEDYGFAPDWTSFPVEEFITETGPGERTLGWIISRGCPHRCAFCYNASFHKNRWKGRSLDRVKEEMEYLREVHGVNSFVFMDDCFFGNPRRAVELLNWMGDNGFLCQSADVRVDQVSRTTMDALDKARANFIFLGAESANQRILKLMEKDITFEETERTVILMEEYPQMMAFLSLMVGFPTETFDEMKETISRFAELSSRRPNTIANLNIFLPIPGTGLYQLALENGFPGGRDLDYWSRLRQMGPEVDLSYFPGRFSRPEGRYLKRAAWYLRMIYRVPPGEDRRGAVKLVTGIFSSLAAARLKHQWVAFPIDLWAYRLIRNLAQKMGALSPA
jgi:anaerobic magnesium-protoporphyrin IX monomethyl ester cyclase